MFSGNRIPYLRSPLHKHDTAGMSEHRRGTTGWLGKVPNNCIHPTEQVGNGSSLVVGRLSPGSLFTFSQFTEVPPSYQVQLANRLGCGCHQWPRHAVQAFRGVADPLIEISLNRLCLHPRSPRPWTSTSPQANNHGD